MDLQTGSSGLPDNAYRELKPGEVYRPVMSPEYKFPEVTKYSVFWGIVMAVIFSAASAYSGLKIGQVLEAAIPISIIAVGISRAARVNKALGQNVIIQSIGASSGVIVAGAIFTIPALYILNLEVKFIEIFFASLFGGFLGILFLIPFRRYFVKDMHGKFPFPEATATTEILITGEKGGSSAGVLIASGLIGGLYDFLFQAMKLWHEKFTSKIIPWGKELSDNLKMEIQFNVSALIFGFGYLIGLKYSLIIASGSMLAWLVFVPLMSLAGDIGAGAEINKLATMAPEDIFYEYVRHIGIGAIAVAGLIGILKSSGVIGKAFKLAFTGLVGGKTGKNEDQLRTDQDIKMSFLLYMVIFSVIAIFIFMITGFDLTFGQTISALLTVVIIAFLFTTVAANAIAIVGTNPVSGMTLMTLILSSFVLTQVGLTGDKGMTSALIIGGIVCTALSMAGGFITDLKIGYWLGSSPIKQQSWKFLGTIVSAATVGVVIYILNDVYGFVKTPETPDPMLAPQANAMAGVIQPLMDADAQFNWMLYVVGGVLAILVNWLGISPLAFALGMYLPIELNLPLIVGGLINHFVNKNNKENEALTKARHHRGTLIASGLIAGAAIFGIIGALLKFFNMDPDMQVWGANAGHGPEWIAIVMFLLLAGYTIWDIYNAKEERH